MPYKNPEVEKQKSAERKKRWRAKKHAERYGPGAGPQNGKHGNQARGSANGRWNASGKMLNEDGYVKVRVGREHPLADPNGYAYEHLLVWAASGRPLPADNQLIHHKDEDKTNNRLDNLEIKTRSEHGAHHIADRDRDIDGRLLPRVEVARA